VSNVFFLAINECAGMPLAFLAPFKREQGRMICGRRCAGIRGNSLLQAAEAGLQLAGSEQSEGRMGAQAQPFEHVTAGAEDGSVTLPKPATRQPADVDVAMTSCSG
jgi:hypothetical protein